MTYEFNHNNNKITFKNDVSVDFCSGTVDKNSANAGDKDSVSGPGRSGMP